MSAHNGHKVVETGLTYAQAGVNISEGDRLVELIQPLVNSTVRSWITPATKGHAAVINLAQTGIPGLSGKLVLNLDGVGTKLKLAMAMGKLHTVGIDLVAMCVNDALRQRATPLAFGDYYGVGKLNAEVGQQVIKGIVDGCLKAGCALTAGETAELRIIYQGEDFDLVGVSLSAINPELAGPQEPVQAGDVVVGLASTGLHSNGYSLVNRLLAEGKLKLTDPGPGKKHRTLGEELLEPTRIYAKKLGTPAIMSRLKELAHVTGGGLLEKPAKMLPANLAIRFNKELEGYYTPLFQTIQKAGNVTTPEMRRTFNCGIGMVLILDYDDYHNLWKELPSHWRSRVIGEVVPRTAGKAVTFHDHNG